MAPPETSTTPAPRGGAGPTVALVSLLVLLLAGAGALGYREWVVIPREMKERAQEAAFQFDPVRRPLAAPAFLGTTPDGKAVTVADARGQVLFVNFWATWCPPCREEMPSMLQLARELTARHPGKFRMVAVSVDEGWPEVEKFFGGRLPAGIDVVLDPEQKATRDYYCSVRGGCPDSYKFPETYIVDASGRLVNYVVGPRDWSDPAAARFLERLIAQ
jgi:thiol-disulfide isomerase/thioredoxin